ncbi:MAG TPA: thiol reductant ABC exporter subunit CydD [Streptosporangiaceae bacterium]|nr:thiol reductant ABC exporter subunit CydD [Streptosporangiaceae bacterium]
MTGGKRPRPIDPRLLRYASAARGCLALTVAAGLAGTGLVLAQAGLLARVLATAAAGAGIAALATPLIALAAVLAARAALSYGGEAAALRAAATVKSQLRRRLLNRAFQVSPASPGEPARPAPAQPDSGAELATLATRGLDGLDAYFARYLPQLVLACLVPLAVLIQVAVADWLSGVIIAVTLPLVPLFAVLVGLHTRARTRQQWAVLARLGGHFLDVVEGLPTLRVFGRGRAQEAAIADITSQYRMTTMGMLRIAFLSALVLELTASLATALVAVEVGLRLLDGHLGYQTALLVLLLTPEAFVPLRSASAQFHASIDGMTAADRVFQVLAEPRSPAPTPAPVLVAPRTVPPDLRHQEIILNEVTLAYPGRETPALSGVSLRIRPGEHIFVTGPSGAGKSSLLALLLRFAEPAAGAIELAGPAARLDTIDPAAWLEQLAWVPQRARLFDDTVSGNIALGRAGAGFSEVRRAARLAGAEEFIAGLEHGYQTRVGERGARLSSGQRQQIALARAFLRDAPVLLLDEPTAHLDPLSAARVRDTITALAASRTIIQVSHAAPASAPGVREVELNGGRLLTPTPADPPGLTRVTRLADVTTAARREVAARAAGREATAPADPAGGS